MKKTRFSFVIGLIILGLSLVNVSMDFTHEVDSKEIALKVAKVAAVNGYTLQLAICPPDSQNPGYFRCIPDPTSACNVSSQTLCDPW